MENSTATIVARNHGNGMERMLDQHPMLGLVWLLVYIVVLGTVVRGIISAFVKPLKPEELMSDRERVRWEAFKRVESTAKRLE